MGTALLINTFINDELKFNHFKITFSEIFKVFQSIHIKVRGSFRNKCIDYVLLRVNNNVFTYQDIDNNDWIASTLLMVKNIKDANIFLYNEDHKLNCGIIKFKKILEAFSEKNIDFLSYSFFKASKLNSFNILPLKPTQDNLISHFYIDKEKLKMIGKISPKYYYISLIALFSNKYINYILNRENYRYKLYINPLSSIIARIFNYRRRKIYIYINSFLNKFNINLCPYPINSPFNFEKIWFENKYLISKWRYGIPNYELFINYDDDNGMYGESLIKRGLYPFNNNYFINKLKGRRDLLSEFILDLDADQIYDCTYFSAISRINLCPVLVLHVLSGEIDLTTLNDNLILKEDKKIFLYSNISPKIIAITDCQIRISIFDEVIKH